MRRTGPWSFSTAYPSLAQYSKPPIISLTWYPSVANSSAARVAAGIDEDELAAVAPVLPPR